MAYYPGGASDFSDDDSLSGYSDRSGAPPPRVFYTKEQRLANAADSGDVEALEDLLEGGMSPDTPLDSGWTALMYAARSSRVDAVRYLLKKGARADYVHEGNTPLGATCLAFGAPISGEACVTLLLNAGAPVDMADRYGRTPLMKAIENKKMAVVGKLIPIADLEVKDNRGRTAAFYAVENNMADVLECLINHGADTDVTDRYSKTLRSLAENNNFEAVVDVLNRLCEDDRDNVAPENDYICHLYNYNESWQDLFSLALTPDKPAYSEEIPNLLFGMYCERLIPYFIEKNYDLFRFLSLTDKDILNSDIAYTFLKYRLMTGLHKFHTHSWSTETISLRRKSPAFDLPSFMIRIGSYLKYMTVIQASIHYISKSTNLVMSCKTVHMMKDLRIKLKEIETELDRFNIIMQKINKKNPPVADLIRPPVPKRNTSKKKKVLCLITLPIMAYFVIKVCQR